MKLRFLKKKMTKRISALHPVINPDSIMTKKSTIVSF